MKKKYLAIVFIFVFVLFLCVLIFNRFYPVKIKDRFSFGDVKDFENALMTISEKDYTQYDGDMESVKYRVYKTRKKKDMLELLEYVGNLKTTLGSKKTSFTPLSYTEYTYNIDIDNYDENLKHTSISISYFDPKYIVIRGIDGKKRYLKFHEGDIDLEPLQNFLQKLDSEIVE